MRYDILNEPNAPQNLGFPSGIYRDNSVIYPGTGNFAVCYGENPG